jgi:signal transduction histidine kinase
LALAGVTLDWRVEEGDAGTTLSAAAVHALRSILREAVSNTLKHAGATAMSVLVAQRDGRVWFTITDNGRGLPETLVAGNGLGNIRARAEALQGSVEIANAQPGLRLHLGIPVSA